MKNYEALYIINTTVAATQADVDQVIEKITKEIKVGGGKVDKVEPLEKRTFSRIANKRYPSGFYVNIWFHGESKVLDHLRTVFIRDDSIFRVLFTEVRYGRTPGKVKAAEPVAG